MDTEVKTRTISLKVNPDMQAKIAEIRAFLKGSRSHAIKYSVNYAYDAIRSAKNTVQNKPT